MQGESSKNALVHFYCRTAAYCALRKSKRLKISYDWRGMPVEFVHDVNDAKDAYKLVMAYDCSGRRISKTRMRKDDQRGYWYTDHVTHYTGIGTEVRESYRRATSPEVEVVVNVPNGLGRYGVEDAADPYKGIDKERAGYIPSAKIEWYLKNHLGSTMLVYGTAAYDDSYFSNFEGGVKAAYDYRAFGEQIDLVLPSSGKVTENFTGKELDDETLLDYFGARYLDPMLGMWTSVDPARQFASPYLYAGNGYNPVNVVDPDGNAAIIQKNGNKINVTIPIIFSGEAATPSNIKKAKNWIAKNLSGKFGKYNVKTEVVKYDIKKHGVTYNVVILSDGPSSQCERGSCAKPANMIPNIAYVDVNSEFVVTHEIAHLLGLDDKYYRDPDKNYMNYKLYTPYPGYDDNLMGGHGKFKLEEWQIEEMWGPGRSDFNDVEPRNRYKANDIREVK